MSRRTDTGWCRGAAGHWEDRPVNRRALVRRPSPRLADGLLTHIDRVPVDLDLAQRQWEAYVAALQAEGWETIEVPPAPDCPDSVFVEDTVVMYDDLAVITRPGADVRRPETSGTEKTLQGLGYRIARIEEPGTLDGGDVLKHAGTVWVGLGGRTNRAGVEQLAALLQPLGATVVGVPVSRVLHLKSILEARGLRCHVVDISEFEKLEGCVTCLSVRLRTSP
jgi:dimethylargininase